MKLLDKKQMMISGVLVLLFLLTAAVCMWWESGEETAETEEKNLKVEFSIPGGFYNETVMVKLKAQGAERVLYTLDGSEPSEENETALPYEVDKGIYLECGDLEQVYTVKAIAYDGKGDSGSAASNTYITGRGVEERYKLPVLVVSGDPAGFYDEKDGILVLGNGNRELRGREYEREVQISLFDQQGENVINQKGGFRVSGAYSRKKNQPSFRLYARSEYDEKNDFNYLFFDNQYNDDNALISKYKRILVRNSGDDNGFAYLRSELASQLSLNAGFPDAQCASPVCVYINSDYYGVYWFVTNYDDWYFARKFGEYDGKMAVLEGTTDELDETEDEDGILRQFREEYNEWYQDLAYCDLQEEKNWKSLNEKIDVENFLQYVAIENYFCNWDAFQNNYKIYRYYSPRKDYQEDTVFDGRYRFLLYDLDETMALSDMSAVELLMSANRLSSYAPQNALFVNLMKRPEAREYYIRYYLSLLNYYFAEEQAVPLMEKMHESHAEELQYLYDQTDLLKGNINMPEDADYNHALNEIESIRDFLIRRPGFALQDLTEAFQLGGTYELVLQNENEANISVDFVTIHNKEYHGNYFNEVPVTVSVTPRCGYRFDYWRVNGNIIKEESFVITNEMIEDGFAGIECITSPQEEASLFITAVKSRGGSDYVELTNLGQERLNLRDYYLSDDPEKKTSSSLPALNIGAGESMIIYCKDYIGMEALGKPGVNFNLKEGETVSLYGKGGELIQSVDVPKLGSRDGVYRMDRYTGMFWEEIP